MPTGSWLEISNVTHRSKNCSPEASGPGSGPFTGSAGPAAGWQRVTPWQWESTETAAAQDFTWLGEAVCGPPTGTHGKSGLDFGEHGLTPRRDLPLVDANRAKRPKADIPLSMTNVCFRE